MKKRRRKKKKNNIYIAVLYLLVIAALFVIGVVKYKDNVGIATPLTTVMPENTEAYTIKNNNIPSFTDEEITSESFEKYSELDALGRCGTAFACLSVDTMPKEGDVRGEIGNIKPSGWKQAKYPGIIGSETEPAYLYNRCHLIGWQLSNENDNPKNLITGTRYLNVTGMLPFENMVAEYIRKTKNHVMYRVTPVYSGDNPLADGVLIEAKSVEDDGCVFCVYCYNIQPGITIDYTNGSSHITEN